MSGGVTRNVNGSEDQSRRFRLTPQRQDQSVYSSGWHRNKESSIAVVQPQKPEEQEERLIRPREVNFEVIKVNLDTRPKTAQSASILTDEMSQIQEVRYCLKTLREQMAARQNSKCPPNGFRVNMPKNKSAVTNGNSVPIEPDIHEESVKLREATECLREQLNEMEKQHQAERDRLQSECIEYRVCLAAQSERLHKAEEQSAERGQQVEELQRLLGSMEIESGILKDKMAAGEAELLQLKADRGEGEEKEQRCAELKKEVAVLKEKIHHLDDMLKSQQRKVREMIEKVQNSRTAIQERDRVIRDLEERVAFLEAENKEMHDHMEYMQAGQEPPPLTFNENKPEVIYSKPLTPTTATNKVLPFIKVIEIKS
ncbi:tuftelin 1b isoform X2 [Mastacembelus armatus]|uniref:Tuftelin 1b n=1 Tax=Mastacembelus armatus TaxID=205130 RepID=A0A7N8X9F4_9TELE|nr:tuftelin-like isoform X2 [Mastacembelus armatus]